MGKRKLKDWVIPVLSIIVLAGAILCYYLISNLLNYNVTNDLSNVTDTIIDNSTEVNKEIPNGEVDLPVKPFSANDVSISKGFYQKDADESTQQKSLIKYENIYMPNTGILYSSDNAFDVMATTDGTITKIQEDKILGKIIEIQYSNNLITVYQSVDNVAVKEGDKVSKGDIIATSGSNKLNDEKANCLHFEVYKDGNLINPEDFYNIDLGTIK